MAQPPLKEVKISNFYNKQGLDDTFEQHIYFAFDDPYRAIDESSIKDWKLILEGTTDKNKNNDATDASSWEQVAKYEPESASSNGVVLFNPRELDAPEFQYNEDPELQRILVYREKDRRTN
ncbi:hypothetical protein [Mycoplasma sp. 'Moose RK']|uniref:hypothetical protein n=1 Tax=Mycoplasma sp. 'Moose RK' TaxID=2780095 RepID=UPI0018C22E3D|nr:hypothetical protein [Mycoplasma sp. 'Moose RK']MBG0731054.1 hypothetical protein [Mycoplasma sp. 'Moose RK']